MRKLSALTVIAASLSGCATPLSPVPDDYRGPLAVIKDSVQIYSTRKADFFYLTQVNETKVEDSRSRTLQVNYGRGMNMIPMIVERKVPTLPATFKVVGRTEYAAPILALTNTVFEITGDVQFAPEKDRIYVVRGQLGDGYSAVWIEDAETKALVGQKIEIKGSAKLGIFQK